MLRDPSLVPLSQQHHNSLVLCVLTRRSLAADVSSENIARLARRVIQRYELELINHFEIEEQVLFPACGPMPLIAELLEEHRALEARCSSSSSAISGIGPQAGRAPGPGGPGHAIARG